MVRKYLPLVLSSPRHSEGGVALRIVNQQPRDVRNRLAADDPEGERGARPTSRPLPREGTTAHFIRHPVHQTELTLRQQVSPHLPAT